MLCYRIFLMSNWKQIKKKPKWITKSSRNSLESNELVKWLGAIIKWKILRIGASFEFDFVTSINEFEEHQLINIF